MMLTAHFKIIFIHPRSIFVRPFTTKTHCLHVIFDNGNCDHVNVFDPKLHDQTEYMGLISELIKAQLEKRHELLLHAHVKHLYQTWDEFFVTENTLKRSYEFSGAEGEVTVQI